MAKLDLFRTQWFNLDGTTRGGVQLLRVPVLNFETVFGGSHSSLNTVTPPFNEPRVLAQIRMGINTCSNRIANHTRDRRYCLHFISLSQFHH